MLTPSQTIGPFFSHALPWRDGPHVVPDGYPDACWLRGRVLDGAGEPVPDALIETWQAGPADTRRFGRCPTDEAGRWAIRTVKPEPPFIFLSIFARGLMNRVVTRVYFADEPAANAADPVLSRLPEPARHTLLATQTGDGYRFDIHLQGEHETVFFDWPV
jgi:protocatechuate 3,4-dioxygenase alpha subunit